MTSMAESAAPPADHEIKQPARMRMLILLTALYTFNFMDRNIFTLLLQDIKSDLRLSDMQAGVLVGMAFALFYSVLGVPVARWADRGNRVNLIALSAVIWSAMMLVFAVATSFFQVLIARVGAASGEAGCVPPAHSLISDYFSETERTRAMSIYMLGAPVSVAISFPMAGWVNEVAGWRMAFLVIALPGLVLAILAKLLLYEPRTARPAPNSAQRVPAERLGGALTRLWRNRGFRHLVIGATLLYLFATGLGSWMPAHIVRTLGVGTATLGTAYAIIWGIGGSIGTFGGGSLAMRYAAGRNDRQLLAIALVNLALIPIYIAAAATFSITAVFAIMAAGAVVYSAIFGPMYAVVQNIVPADLRATAIAVVLLFSQLIGFGFGPVVVGALSDMLAPTYGALSLRQALIIWTPGFAWAAFHFWQAARMITAVEVAP